MQDKLSTEAGGIEIRKTTMIVVPPMVLPVWEAEISKNFPQLRIVKVYAAGQSLTRQVDDESASEEIILAAYTVIEKHNRAAQVRWNAAHTGEDWPLDLSGRIGLLIADEAHHLKQAETGARWTALKLLKADRAIVMTGTLLE
jgi:SNF2 family DNA or RNA helicase